jgi:hypothetical protein
MLAQQMPHLIQHDVRGRHILVRFGQLLGEELLDALALGGE